MSFADQDGFGHSDSPACIGLEIHLQLATASKLFCACARDPKATPNRFICETCVGMPGGLPSLNLGAVERALAPLGVSGIHLQRNQLREFIFHKAKRTIDRKR